VAEGVGAGGIAGIWPQPVSSAAVALIEIAVARRTRIFELLADRARSPPSSSLAKEKRLRSLLLRPAARDTDARSWFI
jgi:hypothetical protein